MIPGKRLRSSGRPFQNRYSRRFFYALSEHLARQIFRAPATVFADRFFIIDAGSFRRVELDRFRRALFVLRCIGVVLVAAILVLVTIAWLAAANAMFWIGYMMGMW
jgi:hypothetical protein